MEESASSGKKHRESWGEQNTQVRLCKGVGEGKRQRFSKKRCSTSAVIKDVQTKPQRYHFIPTGMVRIKKR